MATMIEKLERLGVEAWELAEVEETRWEFYFIGHRLDQNRSVKLRSTEVKVYVRSEDGESVGSASDVISPTATEAEIDATLAKLTFQASLVKNPYYSIADAPVSADAPQEVDVAAIAEGFIRAFAAIPETAVRALNSYEIFVSAFTRHFRNSRGVDAVCTYPSTLLDVVVNAKRDGHEVEIYRLYRAGGCDEARLHEDVTRIMAFAEDRLDAMPTPKLGTADVLLSTEDAVSVYEYFAGQVMADYVVRQISTAKPGEALYEVRQGDALTMRALPYLPNSSKNTPVDNEGNPVRERVLVEDGIARGFWGSRQFSQYLGLAESSLLTNVEVAGGAQGEAAIRERDYLEVVEFSSFKVDSMSGEVAGEIRLAYWHHDGRIDAVTGGSVSGLMAETAPDMLMSRETTQYNNWRIPRATLLPGLRIAGA